MPQRAGKVPFAGADTDELQKGGFEMKIIVDAFGGDHAPLEILKGSAMAVEELGVDILLTGDEQVIRKAGSLWRGWRLPRLPR